MWTELVGLGFGEECGWETVLWAYEGVVLAFITIHPRIL